MLTPGCLAVLLSIQPPSTPGLQQALEAITPEECRAIVEKLASFGTRHTLSDTVSQTRGIGAARRWLKSTMESYAGGLRVDFETFQAPKSPRMPEGGEVVNVVGVLPGSMPEAADRRYYVVGHFDSINSDRMDAQGDAPGANDDASGTAVVLACAKALANARPESTLVFLCVAGEEQGLVGSQMHADAARARGAHILGVLGVDIVGDPSPEITVPANSGGSDWITQSVPGAVRVFSEALPRNLSAERLAEIRRLGSELDSPSRALARYVFTIGAREGLPMQPWIIFRQDRFLRGGDHSSFNDAGFPAVRFTTPGEDYSRQHRNVTQKDGQPYGDLPRFVDPTYVANVAKLNAAVLLHLANAPRPPADARLITAELTTSTTVRWSPSPEPDVAGYDVVWRTTTSWQWEGSKDVGNVTEVTLPFSKDNFFIGVRAYDKDEFRSPVAFCGAAPK